MENANNGKIVVLGEGVEETSDLKTTEIKKDNIEVLEPKEVVVVKEPEKETKKEIINENPKETKKEGVIDEKPNDVKPKQPSGEPLEITFEGASKPVDKPIKPQEKALELSDDLVRNYLESKHGIKIKHLQNLSEKEILSEQVKAFKKFNKETNGTVADLYAIQRDWGTESDETLLENYYKRVDPNLSSDDLKEQIDLIRVTENDELNLDDRELRQRKLDYSREVAKAKGYMKTFQEKYKVSLESGNTTQEPETAEAIAKRHEPYWKQRDKSLGKLGDIKMNIKGLGDIVIPVDSGDRDLVAKNTQTLDSFIQRFQNKDGTMNTERTVRSTLYSDEAFFQKAVQSVAEQVHALTLENFSNENRNVDLSKVRQNTEKQSDTDSMVVLGSKNNQDFAPKSVF